MLFLGAVEQRRLGQPVAFCPTGNFDAQRMMGTRQQKRARVVVLAHFLQNLI
jgi:hypothetical protein